MKSQTKARAAAGAIIKATIVSAILVFASTSNAAQFGVHVVDEGGKSVVGASVCFGLPGSYKQFGAQFTGADGRVMVEVPNIPFVVTVSKTRFSGVRLNEPGRGFNLMKRVTLAEGTPGPRCKAGSTLAESSKSSIHVTKIDVVSKGKRLVLRPVATGGPTEYRVSASANLDNVKWSQLGDEIRLTTSLAGNEKVYLQLRRFEGKQSGWVEARSDIKTVHLGTVWPNL